MMNTRLLCLYTLLCLAAFTPSALAFEKIQLSNEAYNFAGANELKQQIIQLQQSENNLEAVVKKQQQLINTYEHIIEQLKKKGADNNGQN